MSNDFSLCIWGKSDHKLGCRQYLSTLYIFIIVYLILEFGVCSKIFLHGGGKMFGPMLGFEVILKYIKYVIH